MMWMICFYTDFFISEKGRESKFLFFKEIGFPSTALEKTKKVRFPAAPETPAAIYSPMIWVKIDSYVSLAGGHMKIAYFDCFSGVSGDMLLGALVDAGLPADKLEAELRKIPVGGFRIRTRQVKRCGISATKVDVVISAKRSGGHEKARRWDEIRDIIKRSSLSDGTKQKAEGIFRTLFKAESKVHGEPFRKVHLHELAAVDCLVDVFGALIGIELLGLQEVYASPLNVGGGSVSTEHGVLPVPAPATAEILRGVPVYSSGVQSELATPTGAAILRSLSRRFGDMPHFIPDRIGVGAGQREIEGRPNILRVFTGEMNEEAGREVVTVVETNIDDMNPQVYGDLVERLLGRGALDVFMTQVIMKKTRPGTKLTVLCEEDRKEDLIALILRETTSLGVRWHEASRMTMQREMRKVGTRYGEVRVKVSGLEGVGMKVVPEYEDCRRLAKKAGVPLIEVIEETKRAAVNLIGKR
jgi:uncharacterized protein (TIGR00299 family) protein